MTGRIPEAQIVDDIRGMIWSKRTWLENFSSGRNKRPDHDLAAQRGLLATLLQLEADHKLAAQREKGAA